MAALDRKIEQELEFEARKSVQQVQTSPNKGALFQHGLNPTAQQETDLNITEQDRTSSPKANQVKEDTNIVMTAGAPFVFQ